MDGLLPWEEARARILERVSPLAAERVPTGKAGSRVLAEPARAQVDLPPFPSSAMDGYAVRAVDTPGRLRVSGHVQAGRPRPGTLSAGKAVGIATGGVVPDGADAVVPVEYVVKHDNKIAVDSSLDPGANVRPRGGDARSGDIVVPAGTVLRAAAIGALVGAGVEEVVCARRPRAALLVTGDELQTLGRSLGPGQIYESNGPMLEVQLRSAGAKVQPLPRVADEEVAHRSAIERGLACDVLVTSGGVSVGPHDLVRRVEAELGVEEVFWRVAVKPGKPVSFGVRGATLVFGLPGNPVSSLVAFELFVRPALLALQRAAEPGPLFLEGALRTPLKRDPRRDQLVRAAISRENGRVALEPLTGQESHMIVRAATADALVLVPRGEGRLDAGTQASFLPLL